jgi:hypothetical protein
MKALIFNCTTDEKIIKTFKSEKEMNIFHEKVKMSNRDSNINLYYNEATESTPEDHVIGIEGLRFTCAKWDVTWNDQMEMFPSYEVFTTEGFIEKVEAVAKYHAHLIEIGNWNPNYPLECELYETLENNSDALMLYGEAIKRGFSNKALDSAMSKIRLKQDKIEAEKKAKRKAYQESRNTLGNLFPQLKELV